MQVSSNLIDYTKAANMEGFVKDASTYIRCEDYQTLSDDPKEQVVMGSACMGKVNVENAIRRKERLVKEYEEIQKETVTRDPIEVIKKAAKDGKWVVISSVRFPRYWHKVVELMQKMRADDKIHSSFRLFLDLQGYPQNEIPDSFLFNHSISFHLTPKNSSDSLDPGFQDIWSTCFDPKVLDKLTEYTPSFIDNQPFTA